MEGTIANLSSLVTVLAQLGMAAGAWRLANALRVRVDDHEKRLLQHEHEDKLSHDNHDHRLTRLETQF